MSLRRGISTGDPVRWMRTVGEKYLRGIGYGIGVDRSLDEQREQLLGREVRLLDVRRDVRRDPDRDVGERCELPSGSSRQREDGEAHPCGTFGCSDDVRGVAARGDAEQDVAGPSQRLDPASVPADFATCCDPRFPKTIQERAWTSPIWYRPEAIARIAGRGWSSVNVLTNSVARCCASAALPPFPQISSVPPPRNEAVRRTAASTISSRQDDRTACKTEAVSVRYPAARSRASSLFTSPCLAGAPR